MHVTPSHPPASRLIAFPITCRLERALDRVSVGEGTRLALAALLHASRPPRLLARDEPTNHLDPDGTEAIERAIRDWDGARVVLSHDEAFVASIEIHQRIALLRRRSSGGVGAPAG